MVRQGSRLECWNTTERSIPGPCDFVAVNRHRAFFIRQKSGNDVQQRGFAAAAGPDDGHEFAVGDRERDIDQRGRLSALAFEPVSLGDVLDLQLNHVP